MLYFISGHLSSPQVTPFLRLQQAWLDKLYYSLHQSRLSFLKSKDSLEDTSLFSNAAVDETLEKDTVFSDSDSESDNEKELEEEGDESDDKSEIVTLHDNMLQ